MIPAQIIARKRDGHELSQDELASLVAGYAEGLVPDYQMAAFAMAVYLNGMTTAETALLTQQMLESGVQLQWPDDGVPRADKHSTGGVGDKISIPLAPILACCGVQVPMLSGRGLGATGGTLDKLESIPGFRTDLSLGELQTIVHDVGCVITGASHELAPADRKLYALRDVTATVPSIPLITASIMSKKLAESLDAIVLDVKFGSGAFMKDQQQATLLAKSLVQTATRMGLNATALLTDMNQPLGRMVGNAVEVQESVKILKGRGPEDACTLTYALAAEALLAAGTVETVEDGIRRARACVDDGRAWEKFRAMVHAQGGNPESELPVAPVHEVCATRSGIVERINTEELGLVIIGMGGGRRKMSDAIDHSVGLEMLVRIGDTVDSGQPVVRAFCQDSQPFESQIREAVTIGDHGTPRELIVDRITG